MTKKKYLEGYTMHSGGAVGSDETWAAIGQGYGVTDIRHYYYGERTPFGNTLLHIDDYTEGWEKVLLANKTLDRKPNRHKDLLSRNWAQVKYSSAVFAIGVLLDKYTVDGGTAWAVQMAIDAGKPVYVFDQIKQRWYTYNQNLKQFDFLNSVPILSQNFAGIGTRNITQAGVLAIASVYNATLNKQK